MIVDESANSLSAAWVSALSSSDAKSKVINLEGKSQTISKNYEGQ